MKENTCSWKSTSKWLKGKEWLMGSRRGSAVNTMCFVPCPYKLSSRIYSSKFPEFSRGPSHMMIFFYEEFLTLINICSKCCCASRVNDLHKVTWGTALRKTRNFLNLAWFLLQHTRWKSKWKFIYLIYPMKHTSF